MKKVLFVVFAIAWCISPIQAQQRPVWEVFYGKECPHCHEELQWLQIIQEQHPLLLVQSYEIWHNAENRALLNQRTKELGLEPAQGRVPYNIIGTKGVLGFQRDKLLETFHQEFELETETDCNGENSELCSNPSWEKWLQSSWPIMAIALGLVDGFNPCAMWSLFVLLGFLLELDSKKRRWLIGGIFITSSGIIYFSALLMYWLGFGEISSLMATSTMDWIFRGVGILALGTGANALWKARKAQVECTVRNATDRKCFTEKMKTILEKKSLWLVLLGVIGLAFSVNSVELLCSFAIPTTFTATIVSLELPLWKNLSALGLYDLAYMVDDILVFLIAMWTLSLKVFSPRVVQWSHVAGGLLLILIGCALAFDPSILNTLLS